MPIAIPGTTPAMNSCPIETLNTVPYTMNGMLGGMIGPMMLAVAVRHDA